MEREQRNGDQAQEEIKRGNRMKVKQNKLNVQICVFHIVMLDGELTAILSVISLLLICSKLCKYSLFFNNENLELGELDMKRYTKRSIFRKTKKYVILVFALLKYTNFFRF